MTPTKQINTLALAVLLAGLILTALSWRYTLRVVEDDRKQDFELLTVQAEDVLKRRVRAMIEVLQGVRTVFYLQPRLSRSEFRRMVYHNGFLDRYPGIQVAGFIRMVSPAQKAAYEENVRTDHGVDPTGYRHFSIRPSGNRPEYYVITYVEPMDGNEKAFGFDIGSEPVRRSAMEMARDSGQPAATGGITLVQDTGMQTGFLLMAPLYADGTPLQTVGQRRQAFQGLVYLGLRVGETVYKAFSGRFLDRMDLQISGAPQPGEDAGKRVLFDSRQEEQIQQADRRLRRESLLDIGGRKWRLVFFDKHSVFDTEQVLPWLVVFSGTAISLLLAWLVLTLANSKRRAVALADQMTRQLRDSELRSHAVLDNVLDGIVTISELGVVESFNKSAEKIFGYASAEVIGSNVKMLMPEPYHSEHDGYLHNFVSTGNKKIIGIGREVVGRRKDGSTFPMDLAVTEMRLGGKRMFTGIVRDITERVKIERMKSEFISTVSHELRTPLTSIRGSLGLIAGGVAGELPAQAKALVEIAHKNSERLILLVNDILDMEKIEAGKIEFQFRPLELMPLVQQALESNRAYAELFNVSYELENDLPDIMLNVDANRLMQVLANLLSNAAKFSPAGDKVMLAVTRSGKRVRVAVKDHGSGIPAQFRNQIFQKFAQADSSDTRKKGGTGLGLSITKAIVEQMGGSIGFDSEPDVLTTFFIEFPIWEEAAAPISEKIEEKGKRVLICEDDHDIAALLRLMLEQDGLVADIAYDAAQAKKMLAQGGYAAMTLDLALPDQDGIALIRELRTAKETAALPIVVVSAKAIEGRMELDGEAFSVIDWISKPINQDQLVVAVKHALGRVSDNRPKVLHVEDDPDIFQVVHDIVGEVADLDHAASLAEAKLLLERNSYDLAILDLTLPDGSGMELLPLLNGATPPIPVMVFSAYDMMQEEARNVASVLVKSRTDNAQLLATIKRLIGAE